MKYESAMALSKKENDMIARIESAVNENGGVYRSCKRDFNMQPRRRMILESMKLETNECKKDSTEN